MSEPVYTLRGVTAADLPDLLELARHLDSVNLPADDPAAIETAIERSVSSLSGHPSAPRPGEPLFVAEHIPSGRIVGTSSILGRVGRREAPHIYFDVRTEERYSATLDRHFRHVKLQIGFSYEGPTGIGRLVVHPHHRRTPHRVGTQVALVRFLYIAMHRARFLDRLVAELLPPLEPDGTSLLWESVGRKFTGLTYREADRLSKRNKEFIRGLFPDGDIYASLLPPEAQAVIGRVGPQTRGVARLLEQQGFVHARRVDPFDGGPYYEAATDQVRLVREARAARLSAGAERGGGAVLVGRDLPEPPWFRAVVTPHQAVEGGDTVLVPEPVLAHLGAEPSGAWAWVAPMPPLAP